MKRWLSLLLAVVMCFSLFAGTALADGEDAAAEQPEETAEDVDAAVPAEEPEPEAVAEPEPVGEEEPAAEAESVDEAEPAAEEEPADEAEPAEEAEPAAEEEPAPAADGAVDGFVEKDITWEEADASAGILQEGGLFTERTRKDRGAGDQNELVSMLYDAAANWDGSTSYVEVDVSSLSYPESELNAAWSSFLNNNPELFYVEGGYSWSYYNDGTLASVTIYFDTRYSQDDIAVYRQKTASILSGVESGWSDEQKALYIHDYLVTHCEYDLTYSNYSAFDAIVTGSSVCQGYALAYRYLMLQCGVECAVVTSYGLNHAWNLVTISGVRYYVDCTWDDPVSSDTTTWYQDYCGHGNFLRSRSGITSTGHKTTDWIDDSGNDVYSGVAAGTAYDDAWWSDCISAIPHIGDQWAYCLSSSTCVYIHDYSSGSNTELFDLGGIWYVWNGSGYYYTTSYMHLAAYGSYFYASTAEDIYRFTAAGERELVYSLTDNELSQGYIYGIRTEGNTLYYRLYTGYDSGEFAAEHSLVLEEAGPNVVASGTCDYDLTWVLTDDGVLTISGTRFIDFFEREETPPWYAYSSSICSVVIEEGVTSVGNRAFTNLHNLQRVTLPDSVTSIGEYAFARCDSLEAVSIPAGVEGFGWRAFFQCSSLKNFTVAEANAQYSAIDGVLFSKDGTTLIEYPFGRTDTSYVVPDGVKRIAGYSFEYRGVLQSITIPEGVTEIGYSAFTGCDALTSVSLPDSMTIIDHYAFNGCESLTSIRIPCGVTSIGYAALSCSSLAEISFEGSAPAFYSNVFFGVTATACYPAGASGWTADVLQDYGGTITWVPVGGVPLAITAQPASVTAAAGETVTLHIAAESSGTIDYQWEYSKDGGVTWIPCQTGGYKTDTFAFSMKATLDGRQYRCIVSDETSELTSDAAAIALFAITTQPKSVTAAAGEKVTLTVAASGDDLTYQWEYKKVGGKWTECTSGTCKTDTFSFAMKDTLDGRQYRCKVTCNGKTLTSSAATITLKSATPPVITTQPEDVTAVPGETVTLHVAASGDGLTYQWQYKKVGGSWTNCTSGTCKTDTFSFAMKDTLDGRQYRCKVSGGGTTLTSEAATITLFGITGQPKDVNAAAGTKVKLTVKAVGDGLSYQWQLSRDGGETWNDCTSEGSDQASFSFKLKASFSGRQYRCVVMDESGHTAISAAATLTVG